MVMKNKRIQPLEKVGQYGIDSLPELDEATKIFPSEVPLSKELTKAIKDTHYRKTNTRGVYGVQVAENMFFNGGKVGTKQKIIDKYGEEVLQRAYQWFRAFMGTWDSKHEDKMAICGWIADNIFDCEGMAKENKWKLK
jgi:hypothetical protein